MSVINVEHISKLYGDKMILEDLSCSVDEGDKIGIIGINGTGKSTLLRIIAGEEEADEGKIIFSNGMTIGWMGQNPEFDEEIGLISISKVGKYILATKAKQDYFFTIFDSEHTKLIDICRKGNGPNEFIAPIYLEQYEVIGGETKIWVLERATNTFCLINIEQTIKEKKLVIVDSLEMSSLKTKDIKAMLNKLNITGKVLFVTSNDAENLYMGSRNLNKVNVILAEELNVFDIVNSDTLVIDEAAVAAIEEVLN